MIDVPSHWKVTWNHLDLPVEDYTPIESLFCATSGDRLIYLDYGHRNGIPAYSFVFSVGGEDVENMTGLAREEAMGKLAYWLVAAPES
jgi:hypothetical protein